MDSPRGVTMTAQLFRGAAKLLAIAVARDPAAAARGGQAEPHRRTAGQSALCRGRRQFRTARRIYDLVYEVNQAVDKVRATP